MKCPAGIPEPLRICEVCGFGKDAERLEDKCDYPYYRDMAEGEIKTVTERRKDAR